MGFLESVVADVIAAVVAAGVLGLLGWLAARVFRRRREERSAEGEGVARPRPLRVLVALPRPLLTLRCGGGWGTLQRIEKGTED